MKRVRKHEAFDFLRNLFPLLSQCRQLQGQARQHNAGGLRAGDDDGLLSERLNDFSSPSLSHSGSEFEQPGG